MRHDPLADALSTIKNAEGVGKNDCMVIGSNLIGRVLKVMQEEKRIKRFEYVVEEGKFRVVLNGSVNDCGVIKPRFSVGKGGIEKYESRYLPARGFGFLILTTNQGVITQNRARDLGIGGRLLAYVY